ELRMLWDARLKKDRGLLRIEPHGEPVEHGVAREARERFRVGVVGRQRVQVGDEKKAAIESAVLQVHPILDGSEVVAQVYAPRGPQPREDGLSHRRPEKISVYTRFANGRNRFPRTGVEMSNIRMRKPKGAMTEYTPLRSGTRETATPLPSSGGIGI